MDLDTVDDDTLDQLADRLATRLDPGAYGDRVVLSRRQLVGVATGVLGTGTLLSLGVDPAAAQAAGSVGTSSDPVDVFAYDLDVQNGLAMNGNAIENASSVSTDNINLNSGVAVFATDNQTIPNDTDTTVDWQNEKYDDAGEFDLSSGAFVPNKSGRYLITTNVTWDQVIPDGTRFNIQVEVNGSRTRQSDFISGGSDFFGGQLASVIDLSAGATLEIQVNQKSGGDLDIFGSGEEFTWLEITKLS